jgi:HK97 family phage portal protein
VGLFSRRPPTAAAPQSRSIRVPGYSFPTAPPSYATVDVTAGETALQSVAVRSAVDLICSLASELPVHVYRGKGPDRKELPTPSYLLDPAGDGYGLADWSYQVLESWLLRGNAFGEVLDHSSQGFPTQVSLLHPDDVAGFIDSDGNVRWRVGGKLVERPADFLHRRVNAVPGRVLGLSAISAHAAQIGLSLTTTQFGLQWFQDGAHPGGILVNEEADLNPEQVKTAKERFMAALRGTREPVVMGKGWKYQTVQVAPEESQFLETQGWTATECARIFGPGVAEVLGYGSSGGTSLTYTNRVDRSADLLTFALNKWLRRLERLLSEMLPPAQYVRIDRDALLEMTTLDRYRAYQIALQNGFRVINEVREDEDLQPVSWGSEPYDVPQAFAAPSAPAAPADDDKDPAE